MNKTWRAAACRAAVMVVVCLSPAVSAVQAQSVPPPWSSGDVGAPRLSGSASVTNNVFRIDAAGADIWDNSDQFHFVYQAISGDVDVRGRIDSFTATHGWAKAGVMIRGSLDSSAAQAYALVSWENGVAFQRRQANGGASASSAGPGGTAPRWLRVVRAGTRVTAYSSNDGTQWTDMGTDTIALGATAYVGVAVTSHDADARATATVSSLSVSSMSLPAGELSADIGSPAIAGATSLAGGIYTIRAGGADIWDAADQFRYVYRQVSGDVEVVARVGSLAATDVWAKAGVMIRESLSPDSRHAMTLWTPYWGAHFQRRPEQGSWSEHTSGSGENPPGWVRLVRKGSAIESYQSADGRAWTMIGSDSIPMTANVYVGIAVTSHNAGEATTAVVDNLRITEASVPDNRPPTVSLTSPSAGQTFTSPASFTVSAQATDGDGRVVSVDFFANSTLLGRSTSAPYTQAVSSLGQGTYAITALAVDDRGASTVSGAVNITVSGSTTALPRTVAFTASADHDTLVRSYRLEVYKSGTTPGTGTPVATSDLGKPSVGADGEIAVDRATFFQALAPGNYVATVMAVGDSAGARSAPVSFTR
jgi:regulation of enolase protein 1 (concanavalin A-like superfamily)